MARTPPKRKARTKKAKPRTKKAKPKVKRPKVKNPKKRRKRRKPTKLVFQARPKKLSDDQPPPEYTINLGDDIIQDEAYAVILDRLNTAMEALPEGYLGNVHVVPMADGSVDGELYIQVPEGATTQDAEFDLHEAFGSISVGPRYWISTGARWVQVTDDENYRRNKGMTEVGTNYQRATRANIVEEHLILRQHIIQGMERHKDFAGAQAHSVYVRLHWNPEDEQPKR